MIKHPAYKTSMRGMESTVCRCFAIASALSACLLAIGCVRRTISITTDPPNARVFLNDQEIGQSAVTTDFLWYGDYDVIVRKEGYKTLQTHWDVKPPWYQWIPFDFFAEVLWPGWIHDAHAQHYTLEPAEKSTPEEVISRAEDAREKALNLQK